MAETPPSAPPPAATPLAATPPASRHRAWRWLGFSVAALLVLVAIGLGLLTAALHSSSGSAWLVTLLPQLKVVGPQGSLLGDFAAERIEISLPGSSGVLRVDAPRWHALSAGPGDHGRWLHLRIDSLHADRVTLLRSETPTPPDSKPAAPPATLRLPIELEIRAASVDELRLGAGEEATRLLALRGGVHLGDAGGSLHRFDALEARYQQARASGRASIAADAPFQVDAQLALLYEDATPAWQANAAAVGPLEALHVTATARRVAAAARADSTARPNAGSASASAASASASAPPASVSASASAPVADAPSLTADATIRPFAAWPLGQLRATTRGLDLAAFSGSAPATALSGEATVTTTGLDRPASVLVELRNSRAGRWNEGLLPVQRLHADLRARPDAPSALEIQTLVAELGSAQSAAGRVDARGHWSPESWNLEATLDKVRANGLDARAPDTALDGTLSASSRAPSTANAERTIAIAGDLAGTLVDRRLPRSAPHLARLRFDARAGDRDIELHSAEASLGTARASLAGRMTRPAADAPWHAAGRVALSDFDPAPWWPGPPDSLLSRGPNRLNAKGDFDVVLAR
ncbi:MAG: hypothetical protein M3Z29_04310, partial [Pseudomonadota bacterium]|nr:hypothetical protein [Pseudomonadota bacterium]